MCIYCPTVGHKTAVHIRVLINLSYTQRCFNKLLVNTRKPQAPDSLVLKFIHVLNIQGSLSLTCPCKCPVLLSVVGDANKESVLWADTLPGIQSGNCIKNSSCRSDSFRSCSISTKDGCTGLGSSALLRVPQDGPELSVPVDTANGILNTNFSITVNLIR